MAVNKLDPKTIFASEAPAQDTPAVFNNRTLGWAESRKSGGRPTIKQMNALQQDTELKILWLNENAVTPFDVTIDYPINAVTIKDGVFKIFNGNTWNVFLDKSGVGLSNVDNTSDLNKPMSNATQTYIDNLADSTSTSLALKLDADKVGVANGVAPLDATGKVPTGNLPTDLIVADASETVKGVAKIATTAIAQAGVNDSDIITPLKLKGTVFGLGQTRKVVTKISGTTYVNTTSKPIGFEVVFKSTRTSSNYVMNSNITVNSEIIQHSVIYAGTLDYRCSMFVIILPAESYSFNAVNACSIEKVTEMS